MKRLILAIIQVINLSFFNIRNWFSDPRMLILLLVQFITLFGIGRDIHGFSQYIAHPVNGLGVLPHLYNNQHYRLVIQFGMILLFCNAPFATSSLDFVIIRTGYKKWFAGQILYIIQSSVIYVVSIFSFTLIPILPNITFGSSWGSVLSTLSQTSHAVPAIFEHGLQLRYNVVTALLHTLSLMVLLCVLLGLTLFLFNGFVNRYMGIIVSTTLILVSLMPEFSQHVIQIIRVSPASLTRITLLDTTGVSDFPSVGYAYAFLTLFIVAVLAIMLVFILTKTKIYNRFKDAIKEVDL